jgi:hypothetical protein
MVSAGVSAQQAGVASVRSHFVLAQSPLQLSLTSAADAPETTGAQSPSALPGSWTSTSDQPSQQPSKPSAPKVCAPGVSARPGRLKYPQRSPVTECSLRPSSTPT